MTTRNADWSKRTAKKTPGTTVDLDDSIVHLVDTMLLGHSHVAEEAMMTLGGILSREKSEKQECVTDADALVSEVRLRGVALLR